MRMRYATAVADATSWMWHRFMGQEAGGWMMAGPQC